MAKRRAAGEGGIRKRPDGRWEARVSLPDGSRRSVYGATQREALGKLEALRRAAHDGEPPPNDRLTTGEYLVAWLEGTAELCPRVLYNVITCRIYRVGRQVLRRPMSACVSVCQRGRGQPWGQNRRPRTVGASPLAPTPKDA